MIMARWMSAPGVPPTWSSGSKEFAKNMIRILCCFPNRGRGSSCFVEKKCKFYLSWQCSWSLLLSSSALTKALKGCACTKTKWWWVELPSWWGLWECGWPIAARVRRGWRSMFADSRPHEWYLCCICVKFGGCLRVTMTKNHCSSLDCSHHGRTQHFFKYYYDQQSNQYVLIALIK